MGLSINAIVILALFFTSWGKAQETQVNQSFYYFDIYPGIPDGPTQLFNETELKNIPALIRTRHRHYKYRKSFLKAYSQIQKLLIVRDYLIPIVESYANTLTQYNEQTEALSKLEQLKEYILTERKYKTLLHPENIYFEFGETRFQVEGVDPTRLAINTGDFIIFNGEALAARSFSVEELFQIWMHEIFHLDPLTQLREKDIWISKVTQWVREKSQQIELKKNHFVTMLFLPQVEKNIIEPESTIFSNKKYFPSDLKEFFQIETQKQLLIIKETLKKTVVLKEIYTGLQTYHQIPNYELSNWSNLPLETTIKWPHIESVKMQKKANGSLQLDLIKKTLFYEANRDHSFRRAQPDSYAHYSILPTVPKETIQFLYDPITSATEIQRSYAVALPDGDFEVQKISDTNKDRYIQLHLNIPDSVNILNKITSIHLLARDMETNSKLSMAITQYQMINTDEVLLEFKIPQRNMTINQLIIPLTDSQGMYYELSLRPSKLQILYGNDVLVHSDFEVHSFMINQKKKKTDSLKAIIQLNSKKIITGVTLEVDQTVQAMRVNWRNPNQDLQTKERLGSIGVGRKFYFDQTVLKIKSHQNQSTITFNLPESNFSLVQEGPEFHRQIGWGYHVDLRLKAKTLVDTYARQVTNAWVYFSDGSYEKIESSKLPGNFSLISQQEELAQNKREKPSAFNWLERRTFMDLDPVYDNEPSSSKKTKPLKCRKIFTTPNAN